MFKFPNTSLLKRATILSTINRSIPFNKQIQFCPYVNTNLNLRSCLYTRSFSTRINNNKLFLGFVHPKNLLNISGKGLMIVYKVFGSMYIMCSFTFMYTAIIYQSYRIVSDIM